MLGLCACFTAACGNTAATPRDTADDTARLGAAAVTRRASTAPRSGADDLTIEVLSEGAILRWTYRNPGDYDQNREVNPADISVLAPHLYKTAASPDWTRARVADGDGNGEVNPADIATIGANLGRRCDSYSVETAMSAEGSWTLAGEVEHGASTLPESGGPRRFSHALSVAASARWYRVVPRGGEASGPPSAAVFYPQPLQEPTVMGVTPLEAQTGAAVSFAAELGGGAPESYAWNFGGGTEPNTSASTAPSDVAGAQGDYAAHVTVANAAGSQRFDFTLSVTQESGGSDVVSQREAGPNRTVLLVLPTDPLIRRDSRMSIDIDGGTVEPLDLAGYEDVLRTNGAQFPVQVSAGEAFPRLVAIGGSDPSAIAFDTPSVGGVVLERSPARLAFDTAALPVGTYAFRIFDAAGAVLGGDSFTVQSEPLDPFPLLLADWNINVVNRTEADLDALSFATPPTLSLAQVGGAQPAVLWLRARGRAGHGAAAWQLRLVHDIGMLPPMVRTPVLAAQLDSEGTLLLIYALRTEDKHGSGGNLAVDEWYFVELDDPTTAGVDFVSARKLDVGP